MDLSHWDFAELFLGWEAAALILGIEPSASHDEHHRVRVVAERLQLDYERAVNRFHAEYMECIHFPFEDGEAPGPRPQDILVSNDLAKRDPARLDEETAQVFADWYAKKHDRAFDMQLFRRQHMCQWLYATGLKSVYQFDKGEPRLESAGRAETRWPWGDHHTEALGHLEAAARRFWGSNYDPSDPTTAATNSQVAEWLKSERGVSGNLAESIASILRADNLRTGPR